MMPQRDYLWLNLRDLPYFRAILRAVEARFYQEFTLEQPVLDLGCGDGDFAKATFNAPLDVGIDPWFGPVLQASKLGSYRQVVRGYGDDLPFPDGWFSSAISNSVLEHIPDIDSVLVEMARVLKPGALFLFCVPNQNFLPNLSISGFFDRVGLHGLAKAYRAFFNRISRHQHCDSPDIWEGRLAKAGFEVERWWHYFPPQAFHVLEWGHYFGLPSLLAHFLFRRWILVPTKWNLALTRAVVQRFYDGEPADPKGAYTFYVARRTSSIKVN
jgi:SAM-dependent methyltransferase